MSEVFAQDDTEKKYGKSFMTLKARTREENEMKRSNLIRVCVMIRPVLFIDFVYSP